MGMFNGIRNFSQTPWHSLKTYKHTVAIRQERAQISAQPSVHNRMYFILLRSTQVDVYSVMQETQKKLAQATL